MTLEHRVARAMFATARERFGVPEEMFDYSYIVLARAAIAEVEKAEKEEWRGYD